MKRAGISGLFYFLFYILQTNFDDQLAKFAHSREYAPYIFSVH
jgi:hypothetical protein